MSIAHRTVGTGPHTVFVLHGWFGSADGWGDFPAYLDGEAFTWVFTDNRGYGARRDEEGDFSLDEVADDIPRPRRRTRRRDLLDHRPLDGRRRSAPRPGQGT